MQLNAKEWQALGYAETDRVSVVQYLGNLGCRTGRALWAAAAHQRPLTPELARVLIDAGCDPTAQNKNGWDALVWLAWDSHPVDPQVTDLFLSAGCRTDPDGCKNIFNKHRLRFNQILKQHAQWKEVLGRISAERPPADSAGETTPRPGRPILSVDLCTFVCYK